MNPRYRLLLKKRDLMQICRLIDGETEALWREMTNLSWQSWLQEETELGL